MKLELERQDLDTIAQQVTEKIYERLLPILNRQGSAAGAKRLYTVREAGEVLGRGEWAVRHLIRDGKLLSVKDGKRVFIEREVIEKWIEDRKADAA